MNEMLINGTLYDIKMDTIPVKDGFVELVSVFPQENTERAIVRSARVSYNRDLNEEVSPERDAALLDFLIENKHTSPLEMVQFTFHIKVPLSIATQILRHRTASVNCVSHRYTKAEEGWYTPVTKASDIRYQSDLNRQVSVSRSVISEREEDHILSVYEELDFLTKRTFELYNDLLDHKVAREQARFYLPCGTYTRMYWSMDLHNLLNFLRLRLAPDAQDEVREYAQGMYKLIKPFVPNVIVSYERHSLNSIILNAEEIEAIRSSQGNLSEASLSTSSKRKQTSFQEKMAKLL